MYILTKRKINRKLVFGTSVGHLKHFGGEREYSMPHLDVRYCLVPRFVDRAESQGILYSL